jgi:hypothetical protein
LGRDQALGREHTHDTNLLYRDGYDLTWGSGDDKTGRRATGLKWGSKFEWTHPYEDDARIYMDEARPDLTDKTLAEMRIALDSLTDQWEIDWMAPYIQGLLDAEEARLKSNAALAACDEVDFDD